MSDENMDAYAPDVFACGASGIVTEPYTDFRALARRYPDGVLAGEGDNRVLTRNDPDEIEAMVERMLETARMTGGYFLCIGNHIPWDIPPSAIERYLALCAERGVRGSSAVIHGDTRATLGGKEQGEGHHEAHL